MFLMTEKASVLTNAKADLFMDERELDFLLENEEARRLFLKEYGKPYIEVEPLLNARTVDEVTFIKKPRYPHIRTMNHSNWGCSHALSV